MASLPSLLLITRNLPPLRGGMERLNAHMAEALAVDYRVTVIAPRGSFVGDDKRVRMLRCPVPGLVAFLAWAFVAGVFRALVDRPRWVLGGSGLVAPMVLLAGWICGASRAVYLHGLDIVVPNGLYQRVWLPAIRKMHRCIVNSHNTRDLAVNAGVAADRVSIVFPGVTLPEKPPEADPERFRELRNLGTGPIILSVGRLTRRKGLAEFVERALATLIAAAPDAQLVVIGDDAPDALNASGMGQRERIEAAARKAGAQSAIHLLGAVPEDELDAAFAAAAVHVFPGIDVPGDVEGFGMVAIEAAARGLSTVAFAVGGVGDAVEDPASGTLVPAERYELLVEALVKRIKQDGNDVRDSCHRFAARFAWPVFDRAIRAALTKDGRA
ncbi:glycosyltransferase family 4 protein [Luteibacter sp. 22Crub2.1]|uniref:glycosyltransferase family 4 protein n=1 Tax=Luteibacter sp. 22Crub2.1 TaxID=1283288 RepID=UPI0009A61BD5|nr:glycosyltransferase family 4 protein [Luteibacter sp. 22Crub2.1]SKB42685.1 phosphatidylinositol alpha-1,6-mannosyltransferase [Luteibacter sp. 22Crub2.1]